MNPLNCAIWKFYSQKYYYGNITIQMHLLREKEIINKSNKFSKKNDLHEVVI